MIKSLNRFFLRHPIRRKYRSLSNMATVSAAPSPVIRPQKFDYLLILDFEATCDQGFHQPVPQEIIEFPCMKLSTKTWEVESQFHTYVRPVANPVLTSFCTELTGIVQDMVDGQPTLEETLKIFDDWLKSEGLISGKSIDQGSIDQRSHDGSPTDQRSGDQQSADQRSISWAFVTCGDWDLKSMLRGQCDNFGYDRPTYFRRWINIKKIFYQQFKIFPKGMMQMLEHLNLAHEGRHHSGIDDVRNIVQIARVLGLRGVYYDLTGFEK